MNLDNILFINNLPSIDIHGYDRDNGRIAINEFINDNLKLHNEFIVIIHGIGTGILKQECNETLKHNKFVKDYKLWYNNDGCTVVQLNKKNFN